MRELGLVYLIQSKIIFIDSIIKYINQQVDKMKNKYGVYKEESFNPNAQSNHEDNQKQYVIRPIKSPSPDKQSSNIISATKSPEFAQIKKQYNNRNKHSPLKYTQKLDIKQKQFQLINTPRQEKQIIPNGNSKNDDTLPSYKKEGNLEHSRARKQLNIEISPDYITQDFEGRQNSNRYKQQKTSISQLQYIKMLKSKEQTIRQLKQIIEIIDKRDYEDRYQLNGGSIKFLNNKIIQLNNSNKQLKIENQYLHGIIQKRTDGIASKREEILKRQITQLRQSLREKQLQLEDLSQMNEQLAKQYRQRQRLQAENANLMRLLQQNNQIERQDPKNSSPPQERQKERFSLTKIKEQHQQNIKLIKESFNVDIRQIEQHLINQIEQLYQKIDHLNSKIDQLQIFKRKIQNKVLDKQRRKDVREEIHKQKERHQEIQTVLLERYGSYDRQLQDQKCQIDRLTEQLNKAQQPQQLYNPQPQNSQDNEQLLKRVQLLEADLKRYKQLAKQNQQEINNQQIKMERILEESESKIQEYEQNIRIMQVKIHQFQASQRELIQSYRKDKVDTEQKLKKAQLYDMENQEIKLSLNKKKGEVGQLRQEQQRLRDQLKNQPSNTEQLKRMVEENSIWQEKCNSVEKSFSKKVEELQQEIADKEEALNQIINQLKKKLLEKDEHNNILRKRLYSSQEEIQKTHKQYANLSNQHESLKKERFSLNYQTIEGELRDLKRIINDYQSKNKSKLQGEFIQQFYKLNLSNELKIQQNLKLLKDIQQLRSQLINQQKQRLLLNEKISLLQGNIAIYQQELKQRKYLYQNLLIEKTRIEREILLARKIKAEQCKIQEGITVSFSDISNRIDRLVEVEKERHKQISNIAIQKYSAF